MECPTHLNTFTKLKTAQKQLSGNISADNLCYANINKIRYKPLNSDVTRANLHVRACMCICMLAHPSLNIRIFCTEEINLNAEYSTEPSALVQ